MAWRPAARNAAVNTAQQEQWAMFDLLNDEAKDNLPALDEVWT